MFPVAHPLSYSTTPGDHIVHALIQIKSREKTLMLTMRQTRADDRSEILLHFQKCQNQLISLLYSKSPWKLHSNKYKHA